MKALQHLLSHDPRGQPLPLFSKLKEIKRNNTLPHNIQGVPIVQSDCSDAEDEDDNSHYLSIHQQIQLFKQRKAREIAALHFKTGENIDELVAEQRDCIHQEVRGIIDPKFRASKTDSLKDGGSTLPNSQERRLDTPGGHQSGSIVRSSDRTLDGREFTLGQRQASSNCSLRNVSNDPSSMVSEFKVMHREPSSRRIKDKIMNSGRPKNQ